MIADRVPYSYDKMKSLLWSGGSFAQLRARLTTLGCLPNTIVVQREGGGSHVNPVDGWLIYNQFDWSHTYNATFLHRLEDDIPPGRIWASCYDICTFTPSVDLLDGSCHTFDYWTRYEAHLGFAEGEEKVCGQGWHPFIVEHLLPLLPLPPGTCVAYPSQADYSLHFPLGKRKPITGFWRPTLANDVIVLTNEAKINSAYRLSVEIHELCHASQSWEQVMTLTPFDPGIVRPELGKHVPSVEALIELLEYTAEPDPGNWHWPHTHKWSLPSGSIFRNTYYDTPIELGAELCTMYVYEALDPPHAYPRGNFSAYLTAEIREWLREYIFVLPHKNEEDVRNSSGASSTG